MKAAKTKVPELRFPEFKSDWIELRICELLKIGSGKDYKHLSKGEIPVYGTGGLMRFVDNYIYDGESVCIGRKGTIDKPIYLNSKFWTVDTLFYTHSFKDAIPKFVYAIFQNINWYKYNEASGVPSLSKKTIESIVVNKPSLVEQQKIASFLSSVDEKIEKLQKKKELLEKYKKGMMQKIFKQEIKFKDENGKDYKDWKIKKLGEFCNFTQGIQIPQSDQYSTKGENRIRYLYIRDFFSDSFPCYVQNEFPEKIILKNEIMIVNTGNTAGEVYRGKEGVLSNNSFKVTFDNGKFNSSYMFIVLKSYLVQNQIKKFFNSGGQPHLGHKNIALVKIPVPDLSEQVKIADFISAINYKIGLVTTEIEKASQFKKGLLQQMFV